MRVDLPEPETPVRQVIAALGIATEMFFSCGVWRFRFGCRVKRAPLFGDGDFFSAAEIGAGERMGIFQDLGNGAVGGDLSPFAARFGAEIEEIVGGRGW